MKLIKEYRFNGDNMPDQLKNEKHTIYFENQIFQNCTIDHLYMSVKENESELFDKLAQSCTILCKVGYLSEKLDKVFNLEIMCVAPLCIADLPIEEFLKIKCLSNNI